MDRPIKDTNIYTHTNYLIRKVNTHYTQVVHRIRLRKYIPPDLMDIEKVLEDNIELRPRKHNDEERTLYLH